MSETSTPGVAELINQAVDDRLSEMYTCMPGVVDGYDPATQRVSVIPSLKRKYADGTVAQRATLFDVPVWFPAGSNFKMTYPVAKGDPCQLMFTMRSIEIWKRDGGIVDPNDPRRFHISDCWALVGGRPLTSKLSGISATDFDITIGAVRILATPDTFQVTTSAGTFKITPAGKFKIAGAYNLIKLVKEFAENVATATVLTALGPQPIMPPNSTNIATIATQLAAILEE